MGKKSKISESTNDKSYHPGEVVMYQFPPNHIRRGEWTKALIIEVLPNAIHIEIEGKELITKWLNNFKKL